MREPFEEVIDGALLLSLFVVLRIIGIKEHLRRPPIKQNVFARFPRILEFVLRAGQVRGSIGFFRLSERRTHSAPEDDHGEIARRRARKPPIDGLLRRQRGEHRHRCIGIVPAHGLDRDLAFQQRVAREFVQDLAGGSALRSHIAG